MEFICSLPLVWSLFSACLPPPPLATGYVEGEYVLLAPIEIARIESVAVRRGDKVERGQSLVFLERRDAEIALAQASATLAQAVSRLNNISQGRRPEEIAVIEASLASVRFQALEAKRELDRQEDLFSRGITAQSKYDIAKTGYDVAVAQVGELEARLSVARLPARPHEIKAAEAAVDQAKAVQEQAAWRLSKRVLKATGAAEIADVVRHQGEIASPQAPVLSLLPAGAIKLRLYVTETMISGIRPGTVLAVNCDGCAPGLTARVSYVSPDPEFTPPVIYSLQNRQKLVYLIEARPDGDGAGLRPGQIVDVDLKALSQ
jgi:HlyD family secretion protein